MRTEQSERVRLAETMGSAPRDVYPTRYVIGPKGEAERERLMMLRNHARHEHDGRNARHNCPACRRFSPIFNGGDAA